MINKSISKIIFYAPVGNLIQGFQNGGAEAGCKKTIEVLNKGGYQLLLVEKPARKSSSKLDGIILGVNLFRVWLRLIGIMIKDKNAVLHVAGFYLNQIYFEWLLIKTAKILKVRTVYEIRNGGMIESIREGGAVYQSYLEATLLKSTIILCQGYDYVLFIKENLGLESTYYPNYIMDSFVSSNETRRELLEPSKLIYCGRVVPDKNIDFIIDVCRELKILKVAFTLDIIGAYETSYHELLQSKIIQYELAPYIKFHGRMDFKEIYRHLKASHFFVFPSKEKREGHSNALTEAMGCGVVPIVSKAGFNESIVANSDLVMPTFNPVDYAKSIDLILRNKKWKSYSDEVYSRICNNYTESIVKNSLLSAYSTISYI